MIKAGVVGGAGYTGGELLRILVNHPKAKISFVQSKSQSGKNINEVHDDLFWADLPTFVDGPTDDIDVVFLCMGHGVSSEYLKENSFADKVRIIDLSQDYRLTSESHDFIYGLPELNRDKIANSQRIANPGCFATCITLGLLPLAKEGLLRELTITGITGSTGAGQSLSETSHFSWRNNNLSVYKAFEHQHLREIRQSIIHLQHNFTEEINFIPIRGDFPRGIIVTTMIKCERNEQEIVDLYNSFYEGHPFTHVTKSNPHLKQVVNTNNALIFLQKKNDNLLIVSMIDNLLKGASGQAVQNMNLMFGLDEKMGLNLKANAF